MANISKTKHAMAYEVCRLLGGLEPLNYFTHLQHHFGFIYFAVPAAANIRTIGSLNLATAQAMGLELEYKQISQVYNRQTAIIPNPNMEGYAVFNEMLDDPEVIRMAFLRDPASRFAATYRNMFSTNTLRSMPRQKVFDYLGIPITENLTMLDLAELVMEEPVLKQISPQLRSQRQMLAFDFVDYTFIGRHERWDEDFARISHDIFGREIETFDPVKAFNVDPEGTNMQILIDDETRAAIKRAYPEDYKMLDEVDELYPNGYAAGHENA